MEATISKVRFINYAASILKAGKDYNATFYDLPGCVTAGRTVEETIKNANIALQMHIDGMLEDGDKLPEPTDVDKIIKEENDGSIMAIIIVSCAKIKRKRIDITLSEKTIAMIDLFSDKSNRSEFIEDACIKKLNSMKKSSSVKKSKV